MENVRETQGNQVLPIIHNIDISTIQGTMVKISQLQAAVQSALRKEHDYGIIPGTTKPTLLKPGAEKILMMFGLTSEYEVLDRTEDYEKGFFAYTLKCILRKDGQKITEGVGHCNTMEGRYRYRWVTEKNLPEGIPNEILPKRVKHGAYGNYVEYKIENDDPYTLANTVLKMAKKRAQIDAVLTVASLSEVFTQDLEDFKDFEPQEEIETIAETNEEDIRLTFGKHKGKTLGEILEQAPDYIKWLAANANEETIRKACTVLLLSKNQGDNPRQDNTGESPLTSSQEKSIKQDESPLKH